MTFTWAYNVHEENRQIPKVSKVWHVVESTSEVDQIYGTNKETSYVVCERKGNSQKLPPQSPSLVVRSSSSNTTKCNHTRVLVTNITFMSWLYDAWILVNACVSATNTVSATGNNVLDAVTLNYYVLMIQCNEHRSWSNFFLIYKRGPNKMRLCSCFSLLERVASSRHSSFQISFVLTSPPDYYKGGAIYFWFLICKYPTFINGSFPKQISCKLICFSTPLSWTDHIHHIWPEVRN